MGDRRTNDRRMGDRRVEDRRTGDRREPEKGIIKVTIRNMVIYGIIVVIVTAFIVTSIYYIKDKIEEDSIIDSETYYEEYEEEEDEYLDTTYTCNLSIDGDKTELKAGESVIYELKVSDIEAEDGIIMFETLINYDKDIFTCKAINDNDSEWNKTSMIDDYLTMTRNDLIPNSEDQTIAKIEFTAKQNIEPGEQLIDFSEIKFTMDNDQIFEIGDETVSIKIIEN